MRFLFAGIFFALVPACKCQREQSSPPSSSVTWPASVARVPGNYHPSQALFDPDPKHPFNRVHRALFDRKVPGAVSACGKAPGRACLKQSPTAILGGPTEKQEIELGGDEPTLFIGTDVKFLAEPKRADEVDAAVSQSFAVIQHAKPAALVLLQNDLWERYDSISRELAAVPPGGDELARIRKRIVELIRALALPSDRLRALPPSLPEAETAYPEFLAGVSERRGWVEIRTTANEHDGQPMLEGTRHARQAGHRFAFRVLARVPDAAGGSGWLEERLKAEGSLEVPRDTRLVLLGSPLALANDGEIVPVPWVILVETRLAVDDEPLNLNNAPFDVLEGRRELFTRTVRPGGGLQHLAPDSWVPMGATCAPTPTLQVPLRASCNMCHGGKARITGPMTHGRTRLEVESDPARAALTVAQQKSKDPVYLELARAIRAK
jgi:hypothetical protein